MSDPRTWIEELRGMPLETLLRELHDFLRVEGPGDLVERLDHNKGALFEEVAYRLRIGERLHEESVTRPVSRGFECTRCSVWLGELCGFQEGDQHVCADGGFGKIREASS